MSCYVCLSHASFLATGSQANLHLGRFAKAFVSLISYLLPPSLLPSFFLPPWKFIFDINVLALKYFGFPCWKWFWSGRDSVQELSVRFFQNSQITWEHIEPLAYVPTFSCFPFVVKLSPKISVNSWTSFSGQIWTLLQALFTLYFDSLT